MQRNWITLGALPLIGLFVFSGCSYLQANAERHDYRTVLYSLDRLPKRVKEKCEFDHHAAPYPKFLAETELELDQRIDGYLDRHLVIHYNPMSETAVMHETQHYLNRIAGPNNGRVSWECLDELTAYYHAKFLQCRNRSNKLEREARHARARARGLK